MSNVAILVDDISKKYTVAAVRHRHDTLRDHVAESVRTLFRRNQKPRHANETLWALKDVSFNVPHGQVVGLIGPNGAGKSTLLKILSRVTHPTSGVAQIHGRVASLLEVGTGFHPELTGRENIYLSGAILGMRKAETKHRFDEIVEFASIERFIDTPVKRYSSGMHVRLAFAVAAHLDTEIMLVDEVLAVGDASFQKKCLGKMKDVVTNGRTVLFVSHNMAAVMNLCERALLFEGGRIAAEGKTEEIVSSYLQRLDGNSMIALEQRPDRRGNQSLTFIGVELRDSAGATVPRVQCGQPVTLALHYRCHGETDLTDVYTAVGVHGRFDENLFDLTNELNGFRFERIPREGTFLCHIPRLPLQPGSYSFNVYCAAGSELADWVLNAGQIEVEAGDFFGSGRLPALDQGPFLVEHSWAVSAT